MYMSKMKKSQQTKENILKAAHQVTLNDGIDQLTLEAVAREANVSKGGLLYHFPSKEAIVKGMVDYYLDSFEARLKQHLPDDGEITVTQWLHAYIQSSFPTNPEDNISACLLAAMSVNPDLLGPIRDRYTSWQNDLESLSGANPALATIIRLTIDGLWIAHLLGFAPPDKKLQEQISDKLLLLLQELQV